MQRRFFAKHTFDNRKNKIHIQIFGSSRVLLVLLRKSEELGVYEVLSDLLQIFVLARASRRGHDVKVPIDDSPLVMAQEIPPKPSCVCVQLNAVVRAA